MSLTPAQASATPYVPPAPWTTQHTNPSVILDLFPSEVSTPTDTFSKVRTVFVSAPSPTIYVFIDTPQGPGCILQAPFDPTNIYGDNSRGYDVYAGLDPANPRVASVVSIRPMTGCGCGSRLRSFQPFSTMRHTAAPPMRGPLPAPAVLGP